MSAIRVKYDLEYNSYCWLIQKERKTYLYQ